MDTNVCALSESLALRGLRVHFMGVGGIGVSALAEIACHLGAAVSGCDRADDGQVERLRSVGIPVCIGHDENHVADCDLLVYSSAIPPQHPERLAAARQERRGEFLARLLNASHAWGVCGTHGKTSTSWFLTQLLIRCGFDPSVFIGGVAAGLEGGNYRLGSGPFVAELDESDASFLLPDLEVAIVTNIESDHLGHYGDDHALFAAFDRYAAGVAETGLLVAGLDNPGAASLFARHRGRKLSFGLTPEADVRAVAPTYTPNGSEFTLGFCGNEYGKFTMPLPGMHNMQNVLAALGVALAMGGDVEAVRAGTAKLTSVGRRQERLGRLAGATAYSDYAHHPTEVAAAIQGLRQRHGGKMLVVFQPHLYTRTRDYAAGFAQALGNADAVILADIYPAREDPIPGVDSACIARSIAGPAVHGPLALDAAASLARDLAAGFEAVVFMGAGDIDAAARRIVG